MTRPPAPNLDPTTLTGRHADTARMLHRTLLREELLTQTLGDRTETSPFGLIWSEGPSPYRAWFLESLYVALTHREPIIAFRALLQAYAYSEQPGERAARPSSYERDALLEARNRLETVVKLATTFPEDP